LERISTIQVIQKVQNLIKVLNKTEIEHNRKVSQEAAWIQPNPKHTNLLVGELAAVEPLNKSELDSCDSLTFAYLHPQEYI